MSIFKDLLEENPVIAAVKDDAGLEKCCQMEDIRVVFILYGNICNLSEIVEKIRKAGKTAVVHMDLIGGISGREIAVQFVKRSGADGIISTKPALINEARKLDMFTVLRVFLLDSMAYDNIEKEIRLCRPDAVEILPGLMPKVIRKISEQHRTPLIAGGLISDREDVMGALDAGAVSVSSTNETVWNM
ncbi:MAG: glycerol-3-phosphate responsive antiterminator [Lachnospiraceae bacterium]|nr:glycerol-3-phosphate responsive antiterminator [Lachnospiraceae bacterium]